MLPAASFCCFQKKKDGKSRNIRKGIRPTARFISAHVDHKPAEAKTQCTKGSDDTKTCQKHPAQKVEQMHRSELTPIFFKTHSKTGFSRRESNSMGNFLALDFLFGSCALSLYLSLGVSLSLVRGFSHFPGREPK